MINNNYYSSSGSVSSGSEHTYKQTVAKHFDKAAKQYEQFAAVQQDIADYGLNLLEQHLSARSNLNASSAISNYALETTNNLAKSIDESRHKCLLPNILDIGCGTGAASTRLATLAHQVIGADISKKMLAQAYQNSNDSSATYVASCANHENHFCYINADMEQLPLQNESVQAVYSSMALQWCKSPHKVLQEIYRVLTPKGKATIGILVGESFKDLHDAWQAHNKPSRLNQFYSERDWLDASRQFPWQTGSKRQVFSTNHDSLIDMLKSVKNVGANTSIQHNQSGSSTSRAGYITKQEIKSISTYLRNLNEHKKTLKLNYELLFLNIHKNKQ